MARSIVILTTLALGACAHRGPQLEQPVGEIHTTAATLPAAPLAPRIEGRIAVAADGGGSDVVRYVIKNDRVRIQVTGVDEKPKLDVLADGPRGIAALLLDEKKQYALLDIETMAEGAKVDTSGIASVDTGETMRVDGHDCRVWSISDGDHGVRVCTIQGAPKIDLAAIESTVGVNAPKWLRKVAAEGAIPMRVELLDDGATRLVSEMASEVPVDDTKLAVPQGFSKL
ncbi:MAG TPA: DUF4412 domain-containing protein [Labilithrix sp.]|jgi:hypothetical protein